jgi:hypothetical protein
MKRTILFVALLASILPALALAQPYKSTAPTVYKSVANTVFAGDSTYIGGSSKLGVWLTILRQGTADTLLVCKENDTTTVWIRMTGSSPWNSFMSAVPVYATFLRMKTTSGAILVQVIPER